ncbi:MAG: c-type cytochrome [Verrucomicrobiales bacterium]
MEPSPMRRKPCASGRKGATSAPPADERLAKLIADRVAGYHAAGEPDAARGKEVFAQHCAACHRIGNEGNLNGPQLDGIGTRASPASLKTSSRPAGTSITRCGSASSRCKWRPGFTAATTATPPADPVYHEFTIPKRTSKTSRNSTLSHAADLRRHGARGRLLRDDGLFAR